MSIEKLESFIPPGTLAYVEDFLQKQHLLIKITPPRKSRHGSFRPSMNGGPNVIHMSGDLNPYAFLITLLHEIAHLKTWELHGRKALAHGIEWKNIFINLLVPVLKNNIFPDDLKYLLLRHLQNPKAAGSSDTELSKCLKKYDKKSRTKPYLEELPFDSFFVWGNGKIFRKQEKLRKRYRCIEVATKKIYLFSPLAEVLPVRT